ncbi:cysteine--tRNA ligase [Lutispora saccharofermentans]|uniref:Cysteine--tRNA ligase n=1 Tax=Lutispora saccharofermentans TaxID=3024236 RepID=A0ABT1NIS6_9FIRM|nr:cysteine--tRNA ligase [Lutispora saccharofermentans]MCQ1531180.1 cysteine--tRNA ligase [Lutispora saccharofermentans]
MKFSVYNTLTRAKEEIIPVEKGRIKLYTCGPTVYNYAHIGNLRTYIFEDVLKKAMEYTGLEVRHVMNITDVGHLESDSDTGEDKMALGASREKKTVWEIARFYEEAFLKDCRLLNIAAPTIVCRATEHIEDMIKFIQILEHKGFTYIANGNVYFSIEKYPDYARLANLSMEELEAGSRVEVDPFKKNPLDFVLWFTNSKFSNQIMQWESPWGKGFPGWHIECSAMSMKYLGERIDIHCGGVDHIPVHHTNEIAQSESAVGHKWVNYWMHGEFLVIDSGKMSKSSGDFLTLSRLIEEGYSPLDYRHFCLQSRYRKQLVFSFESLKESQRALKKLKSRIKNIVESQRDDEIPDMSKVKEYQDRFAEQIADDLNIANAFTVLSEVIKSDILNNREKIYLIEDFDKVFSLNLTAAEEINDSDNIDEEYIEALILERNKARKEKDWAKADEIRNTLLENNIELIDSKDGTTWKVK